MPETADRTRAAVTVWILQPVVIGRQAGARNAIVVERKNIGAHAPVKFYATRLDKLSISDKRDPEQNIFFFGCFFFIFYTLI